MPQYAPGPTIGFGQPQPPIPQPGGYPVGFNTHATPYPSSDPPQMHVGYPVQQQSASYPGQQQPYSMQQQPFVAGGQQPYQAPPYGQPSYASAGYNQPGAAPG